MEDKVKCDGCGLWKERTDDERGIKKHVVKGRPCAGRPIVQLAAAIAAGLPTRYSTGAPIFSAEYDADCNTCGNRIYRGDWIRSDGGDGWECESHAGEEKAIEGFVTQAEAKASKPAEDLFTGPAPIEPPKPEVNLAGQPEPERDRYGRYMLRGPNGQEAKPFTRATTFAKTISDTFNINQWGKRMVAVGLTLRPDLLSLAHGKNVKADRDELNKLCEQAEQAAGSKVAANLGTALHGFTERLDAGLMALEDAPPQHVPDLTAYKRVVHGAKLWTRAEWIERTTLCTTFGEPVAGTLDRIFEMPDGSLVIGDLKTGSDLSYGWGEISVQLLIYAHGVNEYGLYDHVTKTWTKLDRPVRTDIAIVIHLPIGKAQCDLYEVDLAEAVPAAYMCAQARAWRKNKKIARLYVPAALSPAPAPAEPERNWEVEFAAAPNRTALRDLYAASYEAGLSVARLEMLTAIGRARLEELKTVVDSEGQAS